MADNKKEKIDQPIQIWELNTEELLIEFLHTDNWVHDKRFLCKTREDWKFWVAYITKTLELLNFQVREFKLQQSINSLYNIYLN